MKPASPSPLARRSVLAMLALSAVGVRGAFAQSLVEGQNYLRLKNPQPVESAKNVEVLYFFSYMCPHCRDFDPELQPWLKQLPADVDFRRVPVDFGREDWLAMAKVYYTLESMGVDKTLTSDVFVTVHDRKVRLAQPATFFDWAASKGLDRKKVEDTYNSFGVTSKVNRARQLAKNYNLQSIPVVFVDGKFQVSAEKVGTHANMPAAMNELIAKARAERPK
jgi:thiol:disulfide interchange protein DsbA